MVATHVRKHPLEVRTRDDQDPIEALATDAADPPAFGVRLRRLLDLGRQRQNRERAHGNQGLSIFGPGSPSSVRVDCATAAPLDEIEETVTAGSSSLSYDAARDQYTYVWKAERAWAGTCRQLTLALVDGTVHKANFKFK